MTKFQAGTILTSQVMDFPGHTCNWKGYTTPFHRILYINIDEEVDNMCGLAYDKFLLISFLLGSQDIVIQ